MELTGLELRIAVLIELGYKCVESDKGFHLDIKGFTGADRATQEEVWSRAESIEENVQLALHRLSLADGLQWLLETPEWSNGGPRGLAKAELIVVHSMYRLATAEHELLATAICQAWYSWKKSK